MEIFVIEKAKKEFITLPTEVQKQLHKIVLELEQGEIPAKHKYKKISGHRDMYELRTKYNTNIYRGILMKHKTKGLIVCYFQKKSQKISHRILETAERRFNLVKI